jgi:PKD repeat protein
MRQAMTSSVGGRNNLWTTNNLNSTGSTGVLNLCKAEFAASKTSVCVGESIQFMDDSYNVVSGWNWTFDGGSPATSTNQNPTVVYNTPGVYQVTLKDLKGTRL